MAVRAHLREKKNVNIRTRIAPAVSVMSAGFFALFFILVLFLYATMQAGYYPASTGSTAMHRLNFNSNP
jgi:hypothetical protein